PCSRDSSTGRPCWSTSWNGPPTSAWPAVITSPGWMAPAGGRLTSTRVTAISAAAITAQAPAKIRIERRGMGTLCSGETRATRARLVYRRAVSPPQDPLSSQPAPAEGGGRFAGWRNLPRRSRGLSLRTLVILRWLAILGQSATIFVATAWFHFRLPLWGCLAVIGASVVMNLNAMARLKRTDGSVADGTLTAAHLGFDILQLSVLLALTGGLQNPFCLLLVAPVTVAAASLPGRQAALMGLMVLAAAVCLFFFSMPL